MESRIDVKLILVTQTDIIKYLYYKTHGIYGVPLVFT